jgi:hypothetical protein
MAVILNKTAFEYARKLINNRQCVLDQRDDWTEHQPARQTENRFIQEHGLAGYAKWHLGEDDELAEDYKGRYKFPFGDFQKVHRCALLIAESRAGRYQYFEIEAAATHLCGMLEEMMAERSPAGKERGHVRSA